MITRSEAYKPPSLFSGLAEMLDQSHPLFQLAHKINWQMFDKAFEPLFCKDNGRPAKPIRLMVGLIILKHIRNISDESVVEQWRESAYYQYFCGMTQFSIKAPCEASELVHFRHRIGESGVELIFKESIRVNDENEQHHTGRGPRPEAETTAFIDSTVREKNITFPGDTKIEIPDTPKATDSAYQKRKKHRRFCKRAGIEPVIGHLKSDNRLSRNFYKGLFGDSINVMLAAAAFNFRRAMKALFVTILRLIAILSRAALHLIKQYHANTILLRTEESRLKPTQLALVSF